MENKTLAKIAILFVFLFIIFACCFSFSMFYFLTKVLVDTPPNDIITDSAPVSKGSIAVKVGEDKPVPFSGMNSYDRAEVSVKLLEITNDECPFEAYCDFIAGVSTIKVQFTSNHIFSEVQQMSKVHDLKLGDQVTYDGITFKVTGIDKQKETAIFTYNTQTKR